MSNRHEMNYDHSLVKEILKFNLTTLFSKNTLIKLTNSLHESIKNSIFECFKKFEFSDARKLMKTEQNK